MYSKLTQNASKLLACVLALTLLPGLAGADDKKQTSKRPQPQPTVEGTRPGQTDRGGQGDRNRGRDPRSVGSPNRSGAIHVREPHESVAVRRPAPTFFGKSAPRVYRPIRYGSVYRKIPEYRPVVVRDTRFYVTDGSYYIRDPRATRYIAVRPPVGVIVTSLPADYMVVSIGRTEFYYYGDTWYDTSLRVVEVPVGGFIYELPPRCEPIIVDRVSYYRVGRLYYRPIFREGRTAYERVDVEVDVDDGQVEVDVDVERDSRGFRFSDFHFDLDIDIDDD